MFARLPLVALHEKHMTTHLHTNNYDDNQKTFFKSRINTRIGKRDANIIHKPTLFSPCFSRYSIESKWRATTKLLDASGVLHANRFYVSLLVENGLRSGDSDLRVHWFTEEWIKQGFFSPMPKLEIYRSRVCLKHFSTLFEAAYKKCVTGRV